MRVPAPNDDDAPLYILPVANNPSLLLNVFNPAIVWTSVVRIPPLLASAGAKFNTPSVTAAPFGVDVLLIAPTALNPESPFAPISPLSPCSPFAPTVPSFPFIPGAPSMPSLPVLPFGPTAPSIPFVPFVPAIPCSP